MQTRTMQEPDVVPRSGPRYFVPSHLVLEEVVHGSRLRQFMPQLSQRLLELLSVELGSKVLLLYPARGFINELG